MNYIEAIENLLKKLTSEQLKCVYLFIKNMIDE